jgi:excisionase family DNA binding protein
MIGGTEYLRAADIARLTGMSIRTVRRWIADEIIPSTKLGGARLVARADLERRLYSCPDQAEEADEVPTKHDEESRSYRHIGKA